MLMTLEEARGILTPFVEAVFAAPPVAAVGNWHKFVSKCPELAKPMDSTARANMIHCWMREGVLNTLSNTPDVREITALGFFAVAVGATPLVRFKYLGAGAPQNVDTIQQHQLARHQYDEDSLEALSLEGIPEPPTLLTCGYKLDVGYEITCVELRCDYGKRMVWRWPIWGNEATGTGSAEIKMLPLPDLPPLTPARVRSTRKDKKEDRGEK